MYQKLEHCKKKIDELWIHHKTYLKTLDTSETLRQEKNIAKKEAVIVAFEERYNKALKEQDYEASVILLSELINIK